MKRTSKPIEQRERSEHESFYQHNREMVTIKLKFTQHALNELEDYFDLDSVEFGDDGWVYLTESFPEDDWVYRMILSLGSEIEVLEPEHFREIMKERAMKIYDKY